jgi:hypothetical protein
MYTRWCRQPRKKEKEKIFPHPPPLLFYLFRSDWSAPIGSEYFLFSFIFFSFLGTLMMTPGFGLFPVKRQERSQRLRVALYSSQSSSLSSSSPPLAVDPFGRGWPSIVVVVCLVVDDTRYFQKKIHNSGYIFIHQFFQPPPKKCLPVISDYSIQQKTTTTLFFSVVSTGQIDV